MEPPLAPPLETFFTPGTGVPDQDLREALAAEGQGRTMVKCGYNCLLVETPDGRAVIDTGLGARFLGYGPRIEPLVGRLGGQLAEAGATELSAVLFTHLHQDHARGATWSGELTFPRAITAGRRAPAGGPPSDQAVRGEAAPVRVRRRDPPPRPRHRRCGPHAGPHGVRAGEPRRAAALRGRHLLRQPAAQPSAMADALGSRRGAIGPQPPPSPGLGRRREPPRPRVPHAVSRTGPDRAARPRLPVGPSRLERLPRSPVSGGWIGRRSRRGPGQGR